MCSRFCLNCAWWSCAKDAALKLSTVYRKPTISATYDYSLVTENEEASDGKEAIEETVKYVRSAKR